MSRASLPAMKKNVEQSTPSTVVIEPASPGSVSESDSGTADTAATEKDESPAESRIASSNREDLIRQAAYRRFKERGTPHGDEVQDWLEAEAEINQSLVE